MSGYTPPGPIGSVDQAPDEKQPLLEGPVDQDVADREMVSDEEPQLGGPGAHPNRPAMASANLVPPQVPGMGAAQWPQAGQYHTPVPRQYTSMPPGYGTTAVPIWPPTNMGAAPMPGVDVPDAATYWDNPYNMRLLIAFFAMSLWLFAMTFGVGALVLSQIAGLIGVFASGLYIFRGCSGNMDLPARAKSMTGLTLGALLLDIFSIVELVWVLFLTGLECEEDPDDATPAACFIAYVYASLVGVTLLVHTWLSIVILKRAKTVQMLLNPMSSGMAV